MNVKPEQLCAHLDRGLEPVYVVTGDEHLQVQEACQQIRKAAKSRGYSERVVLTVEPQFNWDELLVSGNSLSLFSDQQLIELRLLNGKPGDMGSKAIQRYLESCSENNLLLVITPKLDKNTQNSKWFKSLGKSGTVINIWPISPEQLPRWIHQRLQKAGLHADNDAVKMLATLVDGNLLAAAQEIEKLKLLVNDTQITMDTIRSAVSDSSHFNVFNLVDTALKGNASKSIKILSRLKGEGVEPLTITWALSREIRQLSRMANDIERGASSQQAMQAQRVWKNRQRFIGSALARLSVNTLNELMRWCADIDQSIKGISPGNPWDKLESVIMILSGKPPAIHAIR